MLTRRHFINTGVMALATAPLPAFAANGYRLDERFLPQVVVVRSSYGPGELHITPRSHYLYFTIGNQRAIRYGVAVGSEGQNFRGDGVIGRKAEWPSWTPTANMIRREPEKYAQYSDGMPGGPENPLGARALYLYRNGRDTYYRIHGTPQPWTIGRSVSSGCIRMVNSHVKDLYERVPMGTRVTVHDGDALMA